LPSGDHQPDYRWDNEGYCVKVHECIHKSYFFSKVIFEGCQLNEIDVTILNNILLDDCQDGNFIALLIYIENLIHIMDHKKTYQDTLVPQILNVYLSSQQVHNDLLLVF
jgi:hypothetical protein